MAKFFNQSSRGNGISTKAIVVGSVVGVLIIIAIGVLISVNMSNSHSDAVVEVGSKLAIEINSSEDDVDKTLFFSQLENVKEDDIETDYSDVSWDKVGTYDVTINIYGKSYETTLEVVDTDSPTLKLQDLTIAYGESYSAEDFVDSCSDNSNEECIINYYSMAKSEDGENIDYSSFKAEGEYEIKITAEDSSGNITTKTATLKIGEKTKETPTDCKYGNSEYDTTKYLLAVDVTDSGCALDLNLYQDDDIKAPVYALIDNDFAKIQKELNKNTTQLDTDNISYNSEIQAVLNTTGNGIVGYTVSISVTVVDSKGDTQTIEQYQLDVNGNRVYSIDTYNLAN